MNTLNDLMVAVADSIRTKEGSNDKIAPVDFAQHIENLQVGGGGGTDGSIEYLDLSGLEEPLNIAVCALASDIKINGMCSPVWTAWLGSNLSSIANLCDFVGVNFYAKDIWTDKDGTIREVVRWEALLTTVNNMANTSYTKADLDAIPRITKEEFYTL